MCSAKNTVDLSIIIVNYMTFDMTVSTIESVRKYTKDISYEVLLVDNNSPNGEGLELEKHFRESDDVVFIQSDKNLGFGKGNNLALCKASGKYIAFLNSDTELTYDSFSNGYIQMESDHTIGALGTRLIDPDGNLDHGCKRGFPTPKDSLYYFLKLDKLLKNPSKYGRYKLSHLNEHERHEVDVISGAFFITRKNLLEEIGSFDEDYFMYGEDIDLCFRIKKHGMRVVYDPSLGNVIHYKGASGKKRKWRTLYHFYYTMIIFYDKNYKDDYNFIVRLLVHSGVYGLFIVKLIANLFKKG